MDEEPQWPSGLWEDVPGRGGGGGSKLVSNTP
jgi:hypothetical protein